MKLKWKWKWRRTPHLSEQSELFNAKVSSGGESVEGKINGRGAMRVPATTLATIGPGLVFLWDDGNLPAVQKLQHQQKHLVPHRVHRDHTGATTWRPWPRRVDPVHSRVEPRRWVRAAEEFPEEEATRRQDAAVRVDQTTLHAESDVAEGLPVDQQVQVIQG